MEVKAYAKINLTLEVLGRRADGYHEVKTILQTIELSDKLHFAPAPRLELVLSAVGGMECPTHDLRGEDNLVWRAADALRRATGCDKGAKIYLEKHIPVGMGLGGGSSDAAATLKALNGLWELGMGDAELQSIAASLGSDVPFFLRGGTALGEGRGEVIVDLPPIPQHPLVLLCPSSQSAGSGLSFPRKTARLYSMLTQEHYTDGIHTRRVMDAIKGGRFSQELLFNIFETVAPIAFDGFEEARRDFLKAGAERVHLSGTGPALYAFVSCKEEGGKILEALKSKGLKAYCVSTIPGEDLQP